MIVFCEDCGAKKKLSSSQVKNKKVSFNCHSCNYKNNYKTDFPNQTKTTSFKPNFKRIVETTSIAGLFIFDKINGIIENHMPKLLKKADLSFLGNHLIDSHEEALSIFPDLTQTQWEIGKKYLTIKKLNASQYIILACNIKSLPSNVYKHLNLL